MDLKPPVKLNLWAHEAKISMVSWRKGSPLFHTEDEITVWFELSKPAYGGTVGFGISLPVADYSREEFLHAAALEGEKELQAIARRHKEDEGKRQKEAERKKELDAVVLNIVNRLEEG
jgi:hypothetical protein